jgi:apolipoprotein N-acyltransferase
VNGLKWLSQRRFLLAALAGVLWACAFPKIGVAGFGWIAPGLIAVSAAGKRGGESFRIGYVAGLAYYLISLYWLLLIPYRWHGVPLGPGAGWLALGAFLALFTGGWVWALNRFSGLAQEEVIGNTVPNAWYGRLRWTLFGAAFWVMEEMVLARVFGGFPWDLLGVSQYQMTPLIQFVSVTGVYGVSFLMVWFSLSLGCAGVMLLRRPGARSVWVAEVFLPMLVVAGAFNFGFRELRQEIPAERTVKVAMIQPSIPQTLIWNQGADAQRLREVLRVSEEALTNKPDLLLWPEAAVPSLLRYDQETFDAITGLARKHGVWMILGADDMEPKPGAKNSKERLFFNCSFLIDPAGKLMERYVKRNLVMFGEYVPLRDWLPFLGWFTPIDGGFTPGKGPIPFALPSLKLKVSTLICYEDIFAHLGPDSSGEDIDFLINLTNDGWFGEGAAQWQHAVTGLFRAIENRRPLVRCTNNGLTCWIDSFGRLHHQTTGGVYGPGFMVADIPVSRPESPTFYNRHGDVFGWGCVILAIGGLGGTFLGLVRRGNA